MIRNQERELFIINEIIKAYNSNNKMLVEIINRKLSKLINNEAGYYRRTFKKEHLESDEAYMQYKFNTNNKLLILFKTVIEKKELKNNTYQMLFSLYQQILNKSYYLLDNSTLKQKWDKNLIEFNMEDIINCKILSVYSVDFFIYHYFYVTQSINKSVIEQNKELQENFKYFSKEEYSDSFLYVTCRNIMRSYEKHKSNKTLTNELKLLFCRIKV